MSFDPEDIESGQCPICQTLVECHAPGVSYVKVDGILYHPACLAGEGIIVDHEATVQLAIENTPKPLTASDLMRVREIVPEPNAFLPETDRPRRWFDVFDGVGQWSLVLSGGLFAAGVLYCERHELFDGCECTARVRLSGLLDRESDLPQRMAYQLEVVDTLTHGINATRADRTPAMDQDEEDEMVESFESGEPARAFALRLCNRDESSWVHASDPYPQRDFPTAEND